MELSNKSFSWILQKIGLILQDFEDFKTEDGDLNSEKLEIEVKRILEGKRDIVFTLQKNIEDGTSAKKLIFLFLL